MCCFRLLVTRSNTSLLVWNELTQLTWVMVFVVSGLNLDKQKPSFFSFGFWRWEESKKRRRWDGMLQRYKFLLWEHITQFLIHQTHQKNWNERRVATQLPVVGSSNPNPNPIGPWSNKSNQLLISPITHPMVHLNCCFAMILKIIVFNFRYF